MSRPKAAKPATNLALLRTVPQGCDNQGRTSPRASTIPARKGAGSYRRRPKHLGRRDD